MQATDLIQILLNWESWGFQSFCDGKYEEVGTISPYSEAFKDDIDFIDYMIGYVYDFVVGDLEDQINVREFTGLWRQRLEIYKEKKIQRLKKEIKTELDSITNLIWLCMGPDSKDEDEAQLQFLNDCIQHIQELKEKITDASPYMQKLIAAEEETIKETIRQHLRLE